MYLCRRVSRGRDFKGGGATNIESLGGTDFSLALFGGIFLGFMDMLSITTEAVIELHVALGHGMHGEADNGKCKQGDKRQGPQWQKR